MKTLLMGPAGTGKTSLMKTTCEGYSLLRVVDLPPTRGISRENYLFRGLLEISIWDAGGQEKYIDRYFTEAQKSMIFGDVGIPIFMLDSTQSDPGQIKYFHQFVKNVLEFSPEVLKIYVLLNKTDLPNAKPDEVQKQLLKDFSPDLLHRCEITPVSVKSGTAQHRLVEILDYILQESSTEMQKMLNIRKELDLLKSKTKCELFLFYRTDGLLITSTMGRINVDPLFYMPLSSGSLESNIDLINAKIQEIMGKRKTSLNIFNIIYECAEYYLVLHEIGDDYLLVSMTPSKEWIHLTSLMPELQNMANFKPILKILGEHRL